MTRVMIVDDEMLMRKGLLSLIDWAALGCEVVATEENGRKAIDAYQQYKPQIIISDIRMPVMDGLELSRWLYEDEAGVKVIILTAFADFVYAQKAIRYGVHSYVTKTGAMDEIEDAVRICKRQLEQENLKAQTHSENVTVFLKSILDGTLLSPDEVIHRAERYHIHASKISVWLMCAFTASGQRVYDLSNIEKMFAQPPQGALYFLPLGKGISSIVALDIEENIAVSFCQEVAQIYSYLNTGQLFIGIGRSRTEIVALSSSRTEAHVALYDSFYDHLSVHLFRQKTISSTAARGDTRAAALDALHEALQGANDGQCQTALRRLAVLQKHGHVPCDDVKTESIVILNLCQCALERVGYTFDDIEVEEVQWKQRLADVFFFEELCKIQSDLVATVCRTVNNARRNGSDLIVDAQSYITAHSCESITPKHVASAVNVSAGYLSRYFKQRTGMTIVDTIAKQRIARAKKLLEAGDLKIYEIALACGFDDTTYFSHVFRKYTGRSPREWQQQAMQEDNFHEN